jgi:ABC-2 type transport system permease protein
MKKILLILVNEIVTLLSRPSFWFAILGVPLVAALVFAVVGLINKNAGASQVASQIFTEPQQVLPEGYVDLSGIIRQLPPSTPPGEFVAYPDEAAARQALSAGKISAFYVVSADYIQSGKIVYIRPDFNPLASSGDQSGRFTWILEVNLAGGDELFTNLVNGPLQVDDTSLATTPTPSQDNPLSMWIPYAITIVLYSLIIGSASLLLGSVSKEKENRVIEFLLTSVTPRQLLTGKILGLGIVGLGEAILWMGMSLLLVNRSGSVFNLAFSAHLPLSFLAWGLVFFVLGYAVYASLMAGLGALAPNLREASQLTFVIMLPLLIPLFFSNNVFAQAPNGAFATGLSLFPLSAPVAMMARLSITGVPWWQPPLAAVLLVLTALLIVRAVSGMFRAQALLSGQGFKPRVFFRALFGKA